MAQKFIFHDFETFGKEVFGSCSQWAAISTDSNFNTSETHNIFCKITDDVVPDPIASLITQITPQQTLESGLCEYDFANYINDVLCKDWDTVIVGYNSIAFDDQVTRFLNYRNLNDAYKWAYDKKRSRFDALPLMRLIHALKPEAFIWPEVATTDTEGVTTKRVSFKLENLSVANGIVHENAHDALSDVHALIGLMKQAWENAPDICEDYFGMRHKWNAKKFIEANSTIGLCNFRFSKSNYISPIKVLGEGSQNKFWTWNLQVDPTPFLSMGELELSSAISMRKEQRELTGTPRSGAISIKINEVPCIFSSEMMKGAPLERAGLLGKRKQMANNSKLLSANPEFVARLIKVYESRTFGGGELDSDNNLYDETEGGFFSKEENEQIKLFKDAEDWSGKAKIIRELPAGRIQSMAFRIVGRNSPESFVDDHELDAMWRLYVNRRILGDTANAFVSIDKFSEIIHGDEFTERMGDSESALEVKYKLLAYAEILHNRVYDNSQFVNAIDTDG